MGRILSRVLRSADAGAELVEYALLAPLLLLVLLGIADFGLTMQAYEAVSNAAREGARMGILACNESETAPGCYHREDIRARVLAFIDAGLPANHDPNPFRDAQCVTVNPGAGGPSFVAERVTVTYTHRLRFIGGVSQLVGGSFGDVPITAVATMRRENQNPCGS